MGDEEEEPLRMLSRACIVDIASWRSWVPADRIPCVCMYIYVRGAPTHTHDGGGHTTYTATSSAQLMLVDSLTVPSELQQRVVGVSLGEGILLSSREVEVVHGHGDATDAWI